MQSRRVGLLPRASIVAAVVLLASCSGSAETGSEAGQDPSTSSPATPSGPSEPYTGYPDSIAVLSHSGSTGRGTEPYEGGDTTTNSW